MAEPTPEEWRWIHALTQRLAAQQVNGKIVGRALTYWRTVQPASLDELIAWSYQMGRSPLAGGRRARGHFNTLAQTLQDLTNTDLPPAQTQRWPLILGMVYRLLSGQGGNWRQFGPILTRGDPMTDIVLISPLGYSPGAVSGVYFALQRQGKTVRKVVAISTADEKVRKAADYVRLALPEDVAFEPILLPSPDFYGGKKATMVYQRIFAWQVRQAHQEHLAVHVAVTGGRSGMGATAALVAQFFGAEALWHLWVRSDIERGGTVDDLPPLFSPDEAAKNIYLNPTLEEGAWELVAVPFVDLHTVNVPPQVASWIQQMSVVIEAETWRKVEKIRQQWPRLSSEERLRVAEEVKTILVQAGLLDPEAPFARVLSTARSVDELERSLRPYDIAYMLTKVWAWLKEHPGDAAAVGSLFLQAADIVLRATGIIG